MHDNLESSIPNVIPNYKKFEGIGLTYVIVLVEKERSVKVFFFCGYLVFYENRNFHTMRNRLLPLIIIALLTSGCYHKQFEELDFIDDVVVTTEVPVLGNETVSVSGKFEIVGGTELQKMVDARSGFVWGVDPSLVNGAIIFEEQSVLNLQSPFSGMEFQITGGAISDLETGTRYYIKSFVEIGGRTFFGDLQTFLLNWLHLKSLCVQQIPARANAFSFVSGDTLFVLGGSTISQNLIDVWMCTSQDDAPVMIGDFPDENIGNAIGFELNGSVYFGLGNEFWGYLNPYFFKGKFKHHTPSMAAGQDISIDRTTGSCSFFTQRERLCRYG